MNELDVKRRFAAIYNGQNVEIDHRLLGGMSNYTYVMNMNDELYTFRIPGDHAEYFVDRNLEKENIKIMDNLNISNETLYFNTENGEKVAKFIAGKSLHTVDDFPYDKVATILKKIHNSGLKAVNDYEPFKRLETYEKYVIDLGYIHTEDYLVTKLNFLKYQNYLEAQPKVLCHGDSQPSNFILEGEDLFTVDFEYCGNNDLMYDIACFANIKLEHGLKLLHIYYDEVDADKLKRFHLWRAFQALQWFNVAVFKDLQGMSAKLKVDFKVVSEKYLQLAMHLLEKIETF